MHDVRAIRRLVHPAFRPLAGVAVGVLLVLTPGWERTACAGGVSPIAATPEERDRAQQHFARGKELYAERAFDRAIDEFRASLTIVASPNTRLYVARCLRDAGRPAEAWTEYSRVILDARDAAPVEPRYAKALEAADEERAPLASQIALVVVRVEHGDGVRHVRAGSIEHPRAMWGEPIPIAPGSAEIVLEGDGRVLARRTIRATAGERTSVTLDAREPDTSARAAEAPEPVSAPATSPETPASPGGATHAEVDGRPDPLKPLAIVTTGIGVAGLATFAVAGILSDATYRSLNLDCRGGPCPASRQGDVTTGQREQSVASVALIVGAAGAATGLTLFAIRGLTRHDSSHTATASTRRAVVVAAPAFVGVRGAF